MMTLSYITSAVGAIITAFISLWPASMVFVLVCLFIYLASAYLRGVPDGR